MAAVVRPQLSKESFPESGPIQKYSNKAMWFWADSFGILKITQSLQFFLWRRVQKEGGNREKNRFGFKRRCRGCFATSSRPSPTCDSSFWWRTALWFSTGRVSGKILPIFTKQPLVPRPARHSCQGQRGLLGYWLKACIWCVWRGDDTFSYYLSHFFLKFLSRRLILGPNQEISHESDPCLVSHVENYVMCILAVTIHPCRNISVFLKSSHWIFQGP